MTKYTDSFKLQVVQQYLNCNVSVESIAVKHGLDCRSVDAWIRRYQHHGEAAFAKKYTRYSADFKFKVLQHMQQDQLSARTIMVLYDLRGGPGVVGRWQRAYDLGGMEALAPRRPGRPHKMTAHSPSESNPPASGDVSTIEQLRQENEYLRAEVAYLKKLEALLQAKKQAAPKKRG